MYNLILQKEKYLNWGIIPTSQQQTFVYINADKSIIVKKHKSAWKKYCREVEAYEKANSLNWNFMPKLYAKNNRDYSMAMECINGLNLKEFYEKNKYNYDSESILKKVNEKLLILYNNGIDYADLNFENLIFKNGNIDQLFIVDYDEYINAGRISFGWTIMELRKQFTWID